MPEPGIASAIKQFVETRLPRNETHEHEHRDDRQIVAQGGFVGGLPKERERGARVDQQEGADESG